MLSPGEATDGATSVVGATGDQKREADSMIVAGVGIGVLGVVTAAIGGAVCPACVLAAPALVGIGAFRRWRTNRRQR